MEREALHSAAVRFSLDLHPSATGDVMEGVRDQLNAFLLRPSVYLDGVLISYTNPRILSQQARIHPYFPYFHVDVSADCVLFKPAAGHILDGKVNMISHDFISLLMLGLFNVSIGRQQIRADLNYEALNGGMPCWRSQKQRDHQIDNNTAVRFRVEKVNDESEFFSLTGSLLSAGTGSIDYLSQQSKKKSKKRRRSEAVATDATPSQAAAEAAARPATTAAAPAVKSSANSDGLAAKVKEKATKEPRRSAAHQPAGAAAQEPAAPATAPSSTAKASNHGEAGDRSASLSPKKKKRRKHQEAPTHAPGGQPSATPPSGHTDGPHRAVANGVSAPPPKAAGSKPATEGAPAQLQPIAAAAAQQMLQPHTGVSTAKQKSHKKKKREIDKPSSAITPVPTVSGKPSGSSTEHAQADPAASHGNAPANGSMKTEKKKKRKKQTDGLVKLG